MGYVIKYIGPASSIVFMLSISFARCIFVISWIPDKEQLYVIYLMVVGFAVSNSVGTGQVRGKKSLILNIKQKKNFLFLYF